MRRPLAGLHTMRAMPQVSREQFAQNVIDMVRSRFPLVRIARAEQSFSIRLNGRTASLENLYRLVQLSPDELKRFVKSNLASYKVPRDVDFVDELPRTSTGKVLKRELRDA